MSSRIGTLLLQLHSLPPLPSMNRNAVLYVEVITVCRISVRFNGHADDTLMMKKKTLLYKTSRLSCKYITVTPVVLCINIDHLKITERDIQISPLRFQDARIVRIQARPTVLGIVTFDCLDNAFECFPGSFRCDIRIPTLRNRRPQRVHCSDTLHRPTTMTSHASSNVHCPPFFPDCRDSI